ncbi:hypothetical protein Patl1_03473 [Pistacia atlantica]|uniref:Uncharacterized protein n=1 Tax=Pistacia atlantica TaxID=434234 RepID=A0ACC1C5K2_9ROSI|nr:hypothetical protein Patl1_03473 [Pistacia atlantica]
MPVPLAPYPTPPVPYIPPPPPPPANGAQSQLVCSGCRNLLLYPVGATSVCCAVCNAVTAVPPPGRFLPFFQFPSGLYTLQYLKQLITSRH